MNRKDFFYRQLVTEGDLDEVFDLVEAADQNFVIDTGLVGVHRGLDVAEAGVPNLTVQVAGGAAYDQTGQRMAVPSTQIVDVSEDSNTVSTDVVTPGNSKWVSVFIQFARALGNPKTDGNNNTVQYDRNESFEFIVEQGTEAVNPTRPALKADAILLADILREEGVTTIVNAAISLTRREWAFDTDAGAFEVKVGQAEEAVSALLELHNDHVTDAAGAHAATAISFTPAGNIAATTVQAAIAELDSEKGGKALANTWTETQAFAGITTTGIGVLGSVGVTDGSFSVYADSTDATITIKLENSANVNEDTQLSEKYSQGQPTTITVGTLSSGYVFYFEVTVLAVRQASPADTHVAVLAATFNGSANTQIGTTTTLVDHGTEAGTLGLSNSGSTVRVTLTPTNDLNVRAIVKRSKVRAAA